MPIKPTSFAFTLLLGFLAAVLMAFGSLMLLATTIDGWSLIVVALAFGLCIPNVMNATLAPLPDIAGAVSATAASIQLTAGAASSGLVSVLFDGRSALSMSAIMAICSLLGLGAYVLIARPAELSRQAIALESGH